MKTINDIINRYREYGQLYEVLKQFYAKNKKLNKNKKEFINEIKKIIVSYYLFTYKFKTYSSSEMQDLLLSNISQLCDLLKKTKNKNGVVKIYPIKESDANKEKIYKKVIKAMVDYQIQNNISTEELFDKFASDIGNQINRLKHFLMENDMELYYGSIYYMVERTLYTINCIKSFSTKSINLEEMENIMLQYKHKYIDSRGTYEKDDDFSNVSEDFYSDYDLIESYYKKMLVIENDLLPMVVEEWKKYLTNIFENDCNYRYVMHCFTSGLVDTHLMNKACCSLYTPTIENLMYGNSGLIYDIDVDSVDTMCTGDAGSWNVNKEEFIKRGCPSRWQLTKLDGDTVWYEYPFNSKLILPSVFENECYNKIIEGKFHYSEIYLNNKARPIGVFYTEECQNVEELEVYAKRHGLPLVKVDTKKMKIK